MVAIVKIKNLHVERAGTTILHDVSIDLSAGTIIGLLGPSGAGKTTLMRVIVGRQKPTAGTVEVLGAPATSPLLRPQLGYMPQAAGTYTDLTVTQNLHYFATMKGVRGFDSRELLGSVGLAMQANQLVQTLSGGQSSRLSLAIALLGRPKLLVLDEPTAGIDPLLREQLWQIFGDLAAGGTSLIISSHAMDEASRCQQLVLMRDGAILAEGTPRALQERTHTTSVEGSFLKLVGNRS